jgi:hypothetical protein
MVVKTALACLLAAVPLAAQQEGQIKVPKDSLLVVVTGCLNGRALRADDVRQTDTTTGITIRSRTFRVAAKKDVMEVVKENNHRHVEVTGLIKKSALRESGIKFKGGRVVVGGGPSGGPGALPDPADNVTVLDAVSVQNLGKSCAS